MSPDRLTFNQLDDDVAAGRVQRVGSVHHRDISPISDTVEAYLATASTAKPLPVSVTAPFPAHMKDTLRIKGFACQLSGAKAAPPGTFLDRSKRRRTIAPKPLPQAPCLDLNESGFSSIDRLERKAERCRPGRVETTDAVSQPRIANSAVSRAEDPSAAGFCSFTDTVRTPCSAMPRVTSALPTPVPIRAGLRNGISNFPLRFL